MNKMIDFLCAIYTIGSFFGTWWIVSLLELPLWVSVITSVLIWVVFLFISVGVFLSFLLKNLKL